MSDNEFFIYLVSNTEDNYNTLSNFTNNFSTPILLDNGNWRFALHSMFCHNQFSNDEKGDYLKVSCNLITPLENQDDTLAIIARKKTSVHYQNNKIFYEPDSKEYFVPNTKFINNIKIQLNLLSSSSNYYTEGAKLLSGQPTVIVLHFMKFNMFSPDFIVRINSSSVYNEMYTKNTASNFRTNLGRSFNFDPESGDREVALSSITYNPEFSLSSEEHLTLKLFNADKPDEKIWQGQCEEYVGNNLTDYVNYLNDKVFAKFGSNNKGLEIICDLKTKEGKEIIELTANKKCVIQLSYPLMFNLGERNFIPKTGISEKAATESYSYKIYLAPTQPYEFQAEPDSGAFFPDMGFVYCDFIKYTNIGEVSAPILKSFPIIHTNEKSGFVTHSVKSLEYYPLSKFDLSNVNFSLRDVSGNLLDFKNKKQNIILTIMIRHQNKDMFYF